MQGGIARIRGRFSIRYTISPGMLHLRRSFGVEKAQDDKIKFRDLVARVKKDAGCPLSCAINAVKQAPTYDEAMKVACRELEKVGERIQSRPAASALKSEGSVCMVKDLNSVGMVILGCKSEFMSSTSEYRELANQICEVILRIAPEVNKLCLVSPHKILEEAVPSGSLHFKHAPTIGSKLSQTAAASGEDLTLESTYVLKLAPTKENTVMYVHGSYVHHTQGMGKNLGRVGSMVLLRVENVSDDQIHIVRAFADNIATHITGLKPSTVDRSPDDGVKSANSKDDDDDALLNQRFLYDQHLTIRQVLEELECKLGVRIKIEEFKIAEVSGS